MTDWHPEQELSVLLDALTEEILAMSDRDVVAAPRSQREEAPQAAQEMRRLIAAAESGPNTPLALESIGCSHSTQRNMN